MIDKIKAGENIELDNVVIDNQITLGESLEKQEEPAPEAEETPTTEVTPEPEIAAEEPVNQEVPEVPAAVPVDVTPVEEASVVPEIPIPIADETSNDNNTTEPEQTYQTNTFDSYSAPVVNAPTYVSNDYSNTQFGAQTPNLLIDENMAIQNLTNGIYREILEPYKNTYSLLSQAVSLLSEIGRNGYVTGPNHDAIKEIITNFGFSQRQPVDEASNRRVM